MAGTTRKKTGKKRPSSKQKEPLKIRIETFVKDEKTQLITGLLLVAFSLLLLVSFLSYLYSGIQDQDAANLTWGDYLFNPNVEVENIAGKLGFSLAHLFIYKWFGFASFAFILLFGISGMKLLKVNLLPIKKTYKYSAFLILWTSVTFSFIIGQSYLYAGGSFGFTLSTLISSLIGGIGQGLFLLITMLAFLMFTIEGFIPKSKIFFKNVSETKNLSKAFNSIKEQYYGVEIEGEVSDNEAETINVGKQVNENNGIKFTKNIEDKIPKKNENVVIDLDTNEPLEFSKKRNFQLTDSGDEIDNELGFEVNTTTKPEDIETETPENTENNTVVEENNVEEAVQQAIFLDNKLFGNLNLEVQQNQDVLYENINRNIDTTDFDPTLDLSNYKVPSIELLEAYSSSGPDVSKEELLRNKNKIVETLKHYKIEIKKIKATIGPTITLYEIIPAPGVRISKIRNLEDDIALSLAALGIRIIAPMPGRGTIGIEVPNEKPEIVSMRSVIKSAAFQDSKMELPIAMGKTISNESYVFDLVKMPHLLMAGATGQGKSVGLNAILASILYKKHPAQVKFVLVDPKKVELTLYEKISKHFLASLPNEEEAIVTDNQKVIYTVNSLNVEMDNRYMLLKKAKVRNIKEYNAKFISRKLNPNNGHAFLPYIVLVIDEFADLIMTAGKEIELPIARLAQLARAIGIHLVVATQRPSTNIITGTIKANFPARLAFKVASTIDSRTILDSSGANQLIGRGDMLISQGSDLIRLQCAFIDTPELERITDYIEKQQSYPTPFYLPEPETEDADEPGKVDLSKRDELFEDSAKIVVLHQQGSTSLIQRKLAIGYNRAGRIMDQLEAAGVVGPSKGSKARDVYYVDEYSLEQLINSLP